MDEKVRENTLKEQFAAIRKADDEAHTAILDKLHDYETALRVDKARDEERAKAEGQLRKQVSAAVVMFMSLITGIVAWAALEFAQIHRDIADNTAHFREFQAIGIEWGDNLDSRDAEIKEDLRQLHREVDAHQRSKDEHTQRRTGQ